jgi:hypothetical protein
MILLILHRQTATSKSWGEDRTLAVQTLFPEKACFLPDFAIENPEVAQEFRSFISRLLSAAGYEVQAFPLSCASVLSGEYRLWGGQGK